MGAGAMTSAATTEQAIEAVVEMGRTVTDCRHDSNTWCSHKVRDLAERMVEAGWVPPVDCNCYTVCEGIWSCVRAPLRNGRDPLTDFIRAGEDMRPDGGRSEDA